MEYAEILLKAGIHKIEVLDDGLVLDGRNDSGLAAADPTSGAVIFAGVAALMVSRMMYGEVGAAVPTEPLQVH